MKTRLSIIFVSCLSAVLLACVAVAGSDAASEQPSGDARSEIVESPAATRGTDSIDSVRAELPDTPEALATYVDGLVNTLQREHHLGAVTVSVVRDDALAFALGYGLADIESGRTVDPEHTLFRIGSVSKTFTWTALKMLAERGAVDLDADVNDYLDGMQIEEAFGQPVTLRHLMHHRAGFEGSMRLFAVADDDPRTLAELVAEHQPARVFRPGTRTSYSNWGSALAALVVEQVAGVDYATFLREEILEPLGMHDTTELPPALMSESQRERLATGYRRKLGALELQGFMQIGAYWPAGGLASTATDMARWMRFHLNGGELDGVRLMSRETHAAMFTRGFDDRPGAADVAHGFQDRHYRGVRTLGHAGGTAAFLTNMSIIPELGTGVFVSHNTTATPFMFEHFPDLVVDRLLGHVHVPFEARRDEAGAEALADLSGTYLNNRRVFTSFAALFGLMNAVNIEALSADDIVATLMGEEALFRRVPGHDDLFESANGHRLQVIRDERGWPEAIADPMGVHTAERVGVLNSPSALFVGIGLAALFALTTALGAWWRLGRRRNKGLAAWVASGAATLGVVAVAVLVTAVIVLAAGFADFDIADMPGNYPTSEMFFMHWAGWGTAIAALVMLLGQWPAWRAAGGWGLWRRVHFALFTLAVLLLVLQLWQWRVFGAPVY